MMTTRNHTGLVTTACGREVTSCSMAKAAGRREERADRFGCGDGDTCFRRIVALDRDLWSGLDPDQSVGG